MMKTMVRKKANPAFKRLQVLPVLAELPALPPRADGGHANVVTPSYAILGARSSTALAERKSP
jgi:hypothetical protein